MSLISIQRSPTPTNSDVEDCVFSDTDSVDEQRTRSSLTARNRSLSECYFTVKGAAVILAHSDQASVSPRSQGHEIEAHLQSMLRVLRPQDTLSMAVRLQSSVDDHARYLAVVSTTDPSEHRESALIGFDCGKDKISIGVSVPVVGSTKVELDGDGGISVDSASSRHLFKPVSIQAMWSIFQCLHKELNYAQGCKFPNFSAWSHTWLHYYKTHATKDDNLCALWHFSLLEDAEKGDFKAIVAPATPVDETSERGETEALVRGRLKHIMQSVDLDDVTSRDIRNKLEDQLGRTLSDYKEFIDREMLVILGQMDRPSRIFDYLYLGTEWNASNWEELQHNKVEYILNVTKEVDNFFPVHFKYMKIWVSDEASTELLMHWQRTYDYIKEAKDRGSIVLVHCKKGISRSSSTVIAYVMKEYGWTLDKALNYVKEKRDCITPNHGFMEQLQTFDGMLQASSNRHSAVFNPLSMSPLTSHPVLESQPSVSSIHTAVPSEDTDMSRSPPTTGLSKSNGDLTEPRLSGEDPEADNSEEDELLMEIAAEQPQEVPVVDTTQPREAAKQKADSGNTGKNSATTFFLHATKRLTGQTHISNLALDRSSRSRFNSGRVKQHREKFESRISHSSAPSSSPNFVSDVAKRIGYISVAVTPPLLSRHKKNTGVAASDESQDNSKNVKNLVDAFERGRDEAGGRRSTNIIVPGRSVMFRLAKVQDWASPLGDGDHRRHTTCHSSQKSAAPVITQRRQCSLAQYPCT